MSKYKIATISEVICEKPEVLIDKILGLEDEISKELREIKSMIE
jgi:hypothetical protein